ncbi:TetR family transcriptional regulator [Micromonosporaceae bacterium Da 78-11]
MAWDTQETRRRLLEAATAEFAEHGLAGARMDRIAGRAGINKERLYNYFGDKDKLFATVLSHELATIAAAVPLTSLDAQDVGDYAGRCFDYHREHPHLIRLLHWEALAYGDGPVPDEDARAEHYRAKVAVLASAQHDGLLDREPSAAHLIFLVMAMAAWWVAVPQVARMVTGSTGADEAEVTMRRAAVVQAARHIAPSRAAAALGLSAS